MALSRLMLSVAAGAVLSLIGGAAGAAVMNSDDLVPRDLPQSLSGAYLAGKSADIAHDIESAMNYYNTALTADPEDGPLLERLLVLRFAAGDIDSAEPLAERLLVVDPKNPIARLLLSVRLMKEGSYDKVKSNLSMAAPAPIAVLTGGLMGAWADVGAGKIDDALKEVDNLNSPALFRDYQHALIADLAGRKDDAVTAITNAYKTDSSGLRIVEAYARILARAGKNDEALAALQTFAQKDQPVIKALIAQIKAGKTPDQLASTAQQGAAEVLYELGAEIGTDEGAELPSSYLQASFYLDPTADTALLALGDVLQATDRCDDALAAYGRIGATSILRANADVQTGICLDQLNRTDDSIEHIKRVVQADPTNLEAAAALGNVYRAHNRFAEAVDAYTAAINNAPNPAAVSWWLFYSRGIALERSKRWSDAEADFRHALQISPNQPQVLNYLGYSWVDQGTHLDEALQMIKQAVDLRPKDGYIVDSLGWAYFQLGRYDDAVTQLERAVELKPADPEINDHLGDAYWKVGRKLEATFQWAHARDFGPEPEELAKIVKKLQSGLTANAGNDG